MWECYQDSDFLSETHLMYQLHSSGSYLMGESQLYFHPYLLLGWNPAESMPVFSYKSPQMSHCVSLVLTRWYLSWCQSLWLGICSQLIGTYSILQGESQSYPDGLSHGLGGFPRGWSDHSYQKQEEWVLGNQSNNILSLILVPPLGQASRFFRKSGTSINNCCKMAWGFAVISRPMENGTFLA